MTASEHVDRDSVAAIIHLGSRYLLQHREDIPTIAYPGWWCLFGGGREDGESGEDAIRRELREELDLRLAGPGAMFMTCTYARGTPIRRARKVFFDIALGEQEADALTLLEGQGMAWLSFADIRNPHRRVLPYDLGVIALHHALLAEPQTMLRVSHPF